MQGEACCCMWTKQEQIKFMEVKTKYVYIMWALQYLHDNLL